MNRTEARAIVEAMITRRIDGAEIDREAARRGREYAFGLPSALRRTQAAEIADAFDARAHRQIRAAEALRIMLEEADNGGRERSEAAEDAADNARGDHGSADRSAA